MDVDRLLLTEQVNAASRGIDGRPTIEILKIISAEDQKVAGAVAVEIPRIAQAVDRIAGAIPKGGGLFYIAAGTRGRLGVMDSSECPSTFHVSPELVQAVITGVGTALSRTT